MAEKRVSRESDDGQEDYFTQHFSGEHPADGEHPSFIKERLKLNQQFERSLCTVAWGKIEKFSSTTKRSLRFDQFHIRPKLLKAYEEIASAKLDADMWASQQELYQIIGRYMDLTLVSHTHREEAQHDYEAPVCLHVLNHVMRTRNLVIANKQKLEAMMSGTCAINEELIEETRDQGLTRPKVLILCPFRKHAYKWVKLMVALMFGTGEQPFVNNMAKFEEEYGDNGSRIHEKRAVSNEFKEMMSGNVDDCFRLGICLAKKCLKLYTNFDESDIILCSPLGLRMVTGGEGDEKRDHDFLSSIEILVISKANVLLMQNWEHVVNVMQTVNAMPSKIQTDISRVRDRTFRHWSLNGLGSFYRQSLLLSDFNFTELHALAALYCKNFAGRATITPIPSSILPSIRRPIFQEFHRFDAEGGAEKHADSRFAYFIKHVMPGCGEHTLIFVPSYFDFVRLRNHFKREGESFVQVHEYAEKGKVAKARQLFFVGKRKFMLFTERFHFYYRYKIKGIRTLLFYQPPTNAEFYGELLNMAQFMDADGDELKLHSKILYSPLDLIRMQNIFGLATAKQLIDSTEHLHAMIGE